MDSRLCATFRGPKDKAVAKMSGQVMAENNDLKAEIMDLKAQNKQLQKDKDFEVRNLSVKLDYAQMQRDDRASEKAQLVAKLDRAKKDLKKTERENSKLQKQVSALTKQLDEASLAP